MQIGKLQGVWKEAIFGYIKGSSEILTEINFLENFFLQASTLTSNKFH